MRDRKDRKGAGKYDRRIQFLEPVEFSNDFNEKNIQYSVKYDNFPACKLEKSDTDEEDNKSNLIESVLKVDWLIRFLPNLGLSSKFRIKDIHDGRIYKIVAPINEAGRRIELMIKTEFVE